MEKIPASKLIDPDDDFVRALHKKLKVISIEEEESLQEFDTNQAAKYCNKTVQTIRSHVKNYIRGNTDAKRIKVKNPDSYSHYIILKKDLDQYIKNPKETL